jgi:serine/threonine protein phosphatase PrpC
MINLDITKCKNYDLITGQWQGNRPYMEDYFFINTKKNIFSVIDGHGGDQIAKFISNDFNLSYIMKDYDKKSENILNDVIIDYEFNTKNMKSGCVMSAFKINDNNLEVCSVGDTYVIIVYNDGTYKLLNKQHSLYDYDEYYRYVMNGSKVRLSRVMRTRTGLIPTRTIGDHSHKLRDSNLSYDPENVKIKLENWDYILATSDGLFDGNEISDIINILSKYDKIELAMREIQMRTTKNKLDLYDKLSGSFYGDNCTIMIIKNNNNKNNNNKNNKN